MKQGDTQLGKPAVTYTGAKAAIEALTGIAEGAIAYASDTDEPGWFDGSVWVWGAGGGGAPTDADYWVETAHGDLSTEVVVGTTGITTAAYTSRQAAAKAGRIFLPNNGLYLERDTGAAWASWGPIYQLTKPPALADWTWRNQGGAVADDTNGGICLTHSGTHSNLRGLERAIPAAPYTITACFLMRLVDSSVGTYNAGLWWTESGGKVITFAVSSEDHGKISIQKWDSVTGWNGNYAGIITYQMRELVWFRISDDSTDRKCLWSHDGYHWETLHSVGRTDFFTAQYVGIHLWRSNADREPSMTLLSWKVE